MYKHPFINDPFAVAYTAFKNLWPDKDCEIEWEKDLKDENGETVYGVTVFGDDGGIYVAVSANLTVGDAIEVLAHELAHVAVYPVCDDHGKEWERAFDDIWREYIRINGEEEPEDE